MDASLFLRPAWRPRSWRITTETSERTLAPHEEWFQVERGIRPETLDRFGVAHEDENVISIPYPQGLKYRRGIPHGERDFWWKQGSTQTLWNMSPTGYGPDDVVFITEGESDGMRLAQAFADEGKTALVVALPGVSSWKSEWAALFAQAKEVYVVLDNDPGYKVATVVDAAWLAMRRDIGPKARRIRLPMNVKDICEYFAQGFDLADLRELVTAPVSRYTPLDLADAHIPRPVNWMVEGLIGEQDIAVMFGEPNSGKSWLTLSLSVAVMQGRETWLGLPLLKQGKVLYIDEENPEDVIYQRLAKLGLRNQDTSMLRYLHEQNIRLDRSPEEVLDEVQAFDPTLIIVDSLTRVHTGNENDAGEMAKLFNDGIKPLGRQTGAAVVVLHHANKVTDGNSYRRMRGSVDIGAAYDSAIEVQQTAPGFMSVKHFKSRRGLPLPPINARLLDVVEGDRTYTHLVTNVEAPPPF